MQPSDIAGAVSVRDPNVSPDGRLVAFVVSRVDLTANRYRSAVWLATTDGSTPPYPLTSGRGGDADPAWSPDGTRLAFTGHRADGDRATLHVVPVGGPGETLTVCERPEAISDPVWSPDGTRIAFLSRERAQRWSDGDDDSSRPPRRVDRLFSRLDGEGWTIDRPLGVFVVAADGLSEPVLVAGGFGDHGAPAWTPDSTQLVFAAVRRRDGDLDERADVHVVDADGRSEPRAVTTSPTLSYSLVSVGPAGAVAALTTDAVVVPSHARVVTVDLADGATSSLTDALDLTCAPFPGARPPVWWDGDLLFSVEDRGDVHVLRVPADGSGAAGTVVDGTRVVGGFDAAGGTVAFVAGTPTSLPELHVRTVDGTERQLTNLGGAFHTRVPVVAPERFTVPSPAGDGDVDVWLIRPDRPADGGRTPVLVSIHGGPSTQYANTWFDEFQLWAGAGYAVVYCNPHGSTGRSEEWVRAIRSAESARHPGAGWAGSAADDVLAALDGALARDPSLDADRVGVLGGSYGGYLTTWLVAHTDRFAAACSERSANNLETLETYSDAAGLFHHEIGVGHLERPEVYRAMSPIQAVRDIRTPLLIVHSDDDLRTPPNQADELYLALRLLGREVEYWRFPAEGHELSRAGSPRHRVQRAELILDFFGRHLGGRRPSITWDHPSRAQA